MDTLQLLENIGADTKRSHKLSIIEQNKNNKLFMNVIRLALDPYINFYIRKIPKYETKGGKTLDWALDELEKLANREFTGHAGIEHLRNIMSNISSNDAIVVGRIIGKDLRCGVADGIVNAVVKDFIPGYPCLLARPYDEKNIKNIEFPAYSQLKADGVRANVHIDGNKITICGRSGKDIDILGAMDADLANLASKFPWPVVLDGELVVVDKYGNIIDRKTGNGIINKAIKGTISEQEAKMIRLQLWDAIPMQEFKTGLSTEIYKQRFERLCNIVNQDEEIKPFWIISNKVVDNLEQAVEHFQLMLSSGEEGTILKNFNALWEDSRSKHLVKMKAEKTADLEVIGWNPGTGQYEGQVGSLICASSDKKVVVSISGFTQELRKYITDNINSIMGTIAEVLYNERIASKIKDRQDVDSLFLPRFNEFRTDKHTADSSEEIK